MAQVLCGANVPAQGGEVSAAEAGGFGNLWQSGACAWGAGRWLLVPRGQGWQRDAQAALVGALACSMPGEAALQPEMSARYLCAAVHLCNCGRPAPSCGLARWAAL
jgi:hypothetical protein